MVVVAVVGLVGVGGYWVEEYQKGGLGHRRCHLLEDWTSHLSLRALLYGHDGPLLVVKA